MAASNVSFGIQDRKYVNAAFQSGYNKQYLRRILRSGVLSGVKIGQMWLIDMDELDAYLQHVENTSDRRCGPR